MLHIFLSTKLVNSTNMENPNRDDAERIITARWSVEVYHRELKQTCGIEQCQAHTGRSQRNHICIAIMLWFDRHRRSVEEKISMYAHDWQIIKSSISEIQMAYDFYCVPDQSVDDILGVAPSVTFIRGQGCWQLTLELCVSLVNFNSLVRI